MKHHSAGAFPRQFYKANRLIARAFFYFDAV